MAVEGKARKTMQNSKRVRKQREDRLSSLPDDILINIISLLPRELAIATGFLSWRWHDLWRTLNFIHVNAKKLSTYLPDTIDEVMSNITPLSIRSFSVKFVSYREETYGIRETGFEFSLDCWLRHVCDRNIRELKVTCPSYWPIDYHYTYELSSFIFLIKSLVSLELDTKFGWRLTEVGDDPINLPNLKNLSVYLSRPKFGWIEQLIEACPSLEKLSLNIEVWKEFQRRGETIKCSNHNVRQLIIGLGFVTKDQVVINTPKLEYLDVSASRYSTIHFEHKPIALREAKLQIIDNRSVAEIRFMTEFYQAVRNVTSLTLDISVLHNAAIVFPNTTRLTLNMRKSHNIKNVLTVVQMCPVLDVLILKFDDIGENDEDQLTLSKPADVSILRRELTKIEIETRWITYRKPTKSFLHLEEYLLTSPKDLEHFHFRVVGKNFSQKSSEKKQGMELKLCKLLYRCPMVSTECEVEFIGRFLKMSRKAGPKAWTTDGEIIPIN